MNEIFDLIYRSLKWISKLTEFTYEEVNIIIWFLILPVIFAFLLDRILNNNYSKIIYLVFVLILFLLISDFENFSKMLFQKSASFLHRFDFIGMNYTQASVLICVVLPIFIVVTLLFLKRTKIKG